MMKRQTALAALLAGLALTASDRATAAPLEAGTPGISTREWIESWNEHFVGFNHRDRETRRGSGFMQFNRYADFVQKRLGEDGNLPLGARQAAFADLKQMEAEQGRAGETWFNIGPANVAGRCLAIEVDPSNSAVVYAGFASGGIWKTTDNGITWTPMGDALPSMSVSAIEIDENDTNHLWIGTGEGWGNVDAVHGVGVLESHDGGATWTPTGFSYAINGNGNNIDVFELCHNPTTGTLMIAALGGLWRSTDGGDTFTEVMTAGHWNDIEMKRGSSNIMFACSRSWAETGFNYSTDDGVTWTKANGGPAALQNHRFALTDADPNVVYWATWSAANAQELFKSTDGGLNFSQVFTGNHYLTQGWYNLSVDVSPTNANTVFSGGVEFYRSTNSGGSFTQIANNVHVDHHATEWDPNDPNVFWIGSDGGVYRSNNGGTSYVDRNDGLVTMQFYAMGQSETMPTRALGGTQDNGTWIYNNSTDWASILGGDGFQCEVDRANANTVYAELYYGDHRRSTTGGGGMASRNIGITEDGPWETPTWMDYSNPQHLWTMHNTIFYRSTNRMDNWTVVTLPAVPGAGRAISQCIGATSNLALLGNVRLHISTNGGTTWIDRTSGQTLANISQDVAFHPVDPNIIYVACATYSTTTSQLRKTTDQGLTWFAIDAGLPDEPINSIEVDPSNPDWIFVGTDSAVYVSFSGGASWIPFNAGLPYVVMEDLQLHNSARIMRVATHGRGMWEVDISDLTATAVDESELTIQPIALRVFGNPASDRTTLRFSLRRAGEIDLALFDTTGRRVKTVKQGFVHAQVDNADVDVSDLAAGVYFARLTSAGATVNAKLVVRH